MSKLSRTLGNSIAHRGILPRSITSRQEGRWWGSFPTGSIARHVKPISQERHRADVLRGNPVPGGFFPSFFIVVLALLASGTSLAQDQKDREFQECPECPIMVGIPSGTFSMGSPPTESGSFDSEGPQHAPTSRHMGTREPRRR
jgi:formylglycine-generating enzyme required for sulfatase activity